MSYLNPTGQRRSLYHRGGGGGVDSVNPQGRIGQGMSHWDAQESEPEGSERRDANGVPVAGNHNGALQRRPALMPRNPNLHFVMFHLHFHLCFISLCLSTQTE